MPKKSFEDKYPNITRWVDEHEGRIEIGYDPDSPLTSFVRAIDQGGMVWEGRDQYESLDDAFLDVEAGVKEYLIQIYGE